MSDYKQTRDAAGKVTSQYDKMLRNLDDDLVERLKARLKALYDDPREYSPGQISEASVMALTHIEELEAKLAKAVEPDQELKGQDNEWKCPINYTGCTKNCGSYGCGN